MNQAPALALELSCRYLVPLLEIVDDENKTAELRCFVEEWGVSLIELRDESNWVSLRFCEALIEWIAEQVGGDALAERVARLVYSPRALGFMYPVLRAIGSPRAGYSRLPQLVRLLNKVSDVRVSEIDRGSAVIEYRPARPDLKEQSPLICRLRTAQLAAGPTIWGLPPAKIEEPTCQVFGGESCRYAIRWVERTPWRGALAGIAAGAVVASLGPHGAMPMLIALAAGGALGHIWDTRLHVSELTTFVEEQSKGLRDAVEDAERRFIELQDAKAEVDAKVEQRTKELKVAIERRVHTEKLAVLGTLVAGVAHEVRNPVNAIVNGLPSVKRHMVAMGAESDYVQMVDLAIDAGEQVSSLVGDLLHIARADRGYEPWDPHQGIDAALRLLGHRTKDIAFERDYQFQGRIVGRPPTLNQIFVNLLDNASRAAGPGGKVRITSQAEFQGVAITVADSGAGVSPDIADRIFDPFFTTRAGDEGTGLGLHFSRQVAYDHGGTLDLTTKPGWGACFRLWLPQTPPEPNPT